MKAARLKGLIIALVGIFIIGATLNIDLSIRQGINGHYAYIHMPLYVKWTQFLARHYEYERLSKDITKGCVTEEEKVLAIFKWTRENIKDIPEGMPLCDDHILNIIIRGYGTPEQFQDVFTTLCAYANIPAFWTRISDKEKRAKYALSFVRLRGKWCVFDAYYGKYFINKDNEIATPDDILNDRSILNGKGMDEIIVKGVPYKEFYYNIWSVKKPPTSRPEKQMPLKRVLFEVKKALKIEKEEKDRF